MSGPLTQTKLIADIITQIDNITAGQIERSAKVDELKHKVDIQSFKLDDVGVQVHKLSAQSSKLDDVVEQVGKLTGQVQTLHDALMGIQPGQDRSFIDRTTRLVQQVESGGWFLDGIIGTAKIVLAVGAIIAAWMAAVKFGLTGAGSP